jgi:MYXO-CTERM domain-containing protein
MARFPRVRLPPPAVAAAFLLLSLAIALASRPTESWANGDPASDVLLAQDVFYPYEPKVGSALEAALERTLRVAAREAGLHLKVAIIARPEELGVVPQLFGHPQAYAQFLDREISFNQPQQLLVVMPAGFGAMPASLAKGLAGVPVDQHQRSFGLTRSAILAVVALARSQGHPIATPLISPSSSSSSPPALLVYGLPALLLALAGLVLTRRRRSRSAGHPPEGDRL